MDAGGVVQQQQQQCVICYEELTEGLSAAPCGHVFHTVWSVHPSYSVFFGVSLSITRLVACRTVVQS